MLDENWLLDLADTLPLDNLRHIAKRSPLAKSVARKLRMTGDLAINQSLDLRQRPQTEVRAGTSSPALADDVVAAAGRRDLTTLCNLLSRALCITHESAFVILSDKKSANVVIALKQMGLEVDSAWHVFSCLVPAASQDEALETSFRGTFASYDKNQCASVVRGWILDDLAALSKIEPAGNDENAAKNSATSDDLIDEVVSLLRTG